VFNVKKFVEAPRVLIGDSTAEQLNEAMPKSEFIGGEGSVNEVIRKLNGTVLSGKVQGVLIVVGRDSLLKGETPESICEQTERLITLISCFKHVRLFIMAPPYIHRKKEEHAVLYSLLKAMTTKLNLYFVSVTEQDRSIVELFRKGTTFNDTHITICGKFKNAGLSIVRSWIFTQVPNFPGDEEIGIFPPTIRSQIVVPHQNFNRGHGLGDRVRHHYSPYQSDYRRNERFREERHRQHRRY